MVAASILQSVRFNAVPGSVQRTEDGSACQVDFVLVRQLYVVLPFNVGTVLVADDHVRPQELVEVVAVDADYVDHLLLQRLVPIGLSKLVHNARVLA